MKPYKLVTYVLVLIATLLALNHVESATAFTRRVIPYETIMANKERADVPPPQVNISPTLDSVTAESVAPSAGQNARTFVRMRSERLPTHSRIPATYEEGSSPMSILAPQNARRTLKRLRSGGLPYQKVITLTPTAFNEEEAPISTGLNSRSSLKLRSSPELDPRSGRWLFDWFWGPSTYYPAEPLPPPPQYPVGPVYQPPVGPHGLEYCTSYTHPSGDVFEDCYPID